MSFKKHDRQYDLVVFGATGYTGLITAEYITTQFPTDLRWAIAGRSADKLQTVIKECKALNPDRPSPEIEIVNLNDSDLAALAKKTFALITTVGPYARYGEHAFRACAEAGTHYFDCTGEAVWTMSMIKKYEAKAQETGACLFPQIGVESAPSDLMTYSMASVLRSELKAPLGDVVVDIHELHSAPSGGTLATVLGLFEMFYWKEVAQSHKPYALSPVVNSKRAPKPSLFSKLTGLVTVPGLGLLTTSITAGTNAAIVMRSWGLFHQEPTLKEQSYGPNFTYREYLRARNAVHGIFMHYSLIVGGILLMFCGPFRTLVRKFIFKPGEGPNKQDSKKDYIELRGVATPDIADQTARRAFCTTRFEGSMYYLTATLLAEAARTVLQDEVNLKGGVFTAACLGQGLINRLDGAGFKFESGITDV